MRKSEVEITFQTLCYCCIRPGQGDKRANNVDKAGLANLDKGHQEDTQGSQTWLLGGSETEHFLKKVMALMEEQPPTASDLPPRNAFKVANWANLGKFPFWGTGSAIWVSRVGGSTERWHLWKFHPVHLKFMCRSGAESCLFHLTNLLPLHASCRNPASAKDSEASDMRRALSW